MTASTILDTVRAPLKVALSGVAANVYDHVPEDPQVPFAVFVPDAPYLEIETIGKATLHTRINLVISAGVAYNSNPASLDNIEQLITSVVAVIPAGYDVEVVDRPTVTTVGASNLLVADIRVSTWYTQTA